MLMMMTGRIVTAALLGVAAGWGLHACTGSAQAAADESRSAPSPNAASGSPAQGSTRQSVVGIGGVFFRVPEPGATQAWYAKHLGVPVRSFEGQEIVLFEWRERGNADRLGHTVWSLMEPKSTYFDVGTRRGADYMINYRVANLDAMLAQLRQAGIHVLDGPQTSFNGRFAWIADLDGRKVELWEPAPGF